MNSRVRFFLATVTLALLTTALPASAEIVFLTSGHTLSVKSHRLDGGSIIFTLRGGGEFTCDRALVEKIEPDEVPYVEPAGAQQPAAAPSGQDLTVLASTPYGDLIASMSEAHGVNPLLVRAMIQVESGYKPKARSRKGALGLMQLMPATAREYKVRNPYDPKANIEGGIKHLKSLLDRFDGGVELALAAYNAGAGAVDRFKGIPPYRETKNYVSRILSLAGLK